MSSLIGQHIGKYRVTRQVGRGGMGTVYGAVDQTLHREVALKVLNAGLDDPTVARRFRAEAIAVARLNHPGIATIYELLQHDGQWLMVMEFVRGDTLEERLAGSGHLPVDRAADLTMQLLAALAHAHDQGVIHRDLKPGNIMLSTGDGLRVMDFGIARIAGAEQLTSAGVTLGTPAYMAPEQVLGGDIDARTDLYAVGIVLFQMVTGVMPFEGATALQVAQARLVGPPRSVRDVAPDLPDWLPQVLDIALAREPADRFQSATQFREAIRRGLAGVPIDGEMSTPPASMATPALPERGLHIVPGGAPPPTVDVAMLETQMPSPQLAALSTRITTSPSSDASAPAPDATADPPKRLSPPVVAVAAAVLIVATAGAWWVMRGPADVVSAPEEASAQLSGDGDTGADPSSMAAPPDDAPPRPPDTSAGPVDTARGRGASGPVPSSPAAQPPAPPAASNTASRPPARSPAASGPAAAAPAAAEPVPAVFRGVRALVLDGPRADEKPAVLTFGEGAVRLFDESGQVAFAEMAYQQVTSAAYSRGRDPRWFPTLAGPPIDTDMPGGLFRGRYHWLALQSRAAWMIVRMSDNDWQQITASVTERLGLPIETLPPQ